MSGSRPAQGNELEECERGQDCEGDIGRCRSRANIDTDPAFSGGVVSGHEGYGPARVKLELLDIHLHGTGEDGQHVLAERPQDAYRALPSTAGAESTFRGQAAALAGDQVREHGIRFTEEDVVFHSRPEGRVGDLLVELTGADIVAKAAPLGLECPEGFHECEREGGAEDLDLVRVEEATQEVAVHGLPAVGCEDHVLGTTRLETALLLPHPECIGTDHVSGRSPGLQAAFGCREFPAEEEFQDPGSSVHRINPADHITDHTINI